MLVERLKTAGEYDLVGGAAYLAEILRSVPTAANATYYAQIVRDKSTLRSLIHSSTDILREAYDESHDPRETLGPCRGKDLLHPRRARPGELADIRDVLQDAMGGIDARMKNEHAVGGQ